MTPRPGRSFGERFAVLEVEALGQVVDRPAAVVVFHQHGARERGEAVDESRGRDRSGEVRHDAHRVGFAERRNLHHLGDAADVRQCRADEVDVVAFDQPVEVPLETPFLTMRQRHRRHLPQLRDVLKRVFVTHRILDEERLVLLDRPARAKRIVEVEALMEIDAPVPVRADSLAHVFAVLRDLPDD